jgi:glutaredoxin
VAETAVVLFTAHACAHSVAARTYLVNRGIVFSEQNVTGDGDAMQRLIWLTGHASVPAIVIGDQVLVGFDPDRLEEMLRGRLPG